MCSICVFTALIVCAAAANVYNESTGINGEKVRFDNYTVYEIKLENITQVFLIEPLRAQYGQYDIWKEYDDDTKCMNIMVAPKEVFNFEQFLKFNGLQNKLLIDNVQDLIDREEKRHFLTPRSNNYDWTVYHKWPEMKNWIRNILKSYPSVARGFIVGKTYQNRKIRGIKISYKSGNPGIFIESGIHAREWIAPATATWFINELLTSNDKDVRYLAENYDWYILPVLNVDGYIYSHTKNRLWRKTRKPNANRKCVGTDANRNFDFQWQPVPGSSASNPCSDTYAGSMPWSQPETLALSQYLIAIKNKIKMYFALHSFGQFIFSPYTYTTKEVPANNQHMLDIGKEFVDAIFGLPYHTRYTAGSAAKFLYPAGGTSGDWVYAILNIQLSYTVEFRDLGQRGFDLPPAAMLANYEEFMTGMVAAVKKARALHYL